MGSGNHVYIGTYLIVNAPRRQEIVTFQGCGNDDCDRKDVAQSGKFCPTCGNKIEDCQTVEEDWPYPYELLSEDFGEDFEDSFWSHNIHDNRHICLPNETVTEIGLTLDGYFEDDEVELELPNFVFSKVKFEQKYAQEIEQLKENGATIELKFGIFQFYC